MSVTLEIEGLEKLSQAFASLPDSVEAGVKIDNPEVVLRGMVWEWGWIDLSRVGPKTVISTNAAGETRVLTVTAPYGWVRINQHRYAEFIKEEIKRVRWGDINFAHWLEAARNALLIAAARCAELMAETAPVDKGDLRAAIVPVGHGDDALNNDEQGFQLGVF